MDFEFTYIFELVNHDACKIALENLQKVLKRGGKNALLQKNSGKIMTKINSRKVGWYIYINI